MSELKAELDRLRAQLSAATVLIENWDLEHSKHVNYRHDWCQILEGGSVIPGAPAPKCTCGLWEAEQAYYDLLGQRM